MPIIPLLSIVFLGALLSAIGGIFLKMGAIELGKIRSLYDLFMVFLNWKISVGLLMYFIPAVIWIILLRKVELSLLQPMMSIIYVITPVLAIATLHEYVSPMRWAGIAIIIVGVIVISRSA